MSKRKAQDDNLKSLADDFGQLKAQIATLEKRKKSLVQLFQEAGVHELEGELFRCVVSSVPDSVGPDWKTIATKMKPSRQMLAANQKVNKKAHTRISVYARTDDGDV
jgi:hypothetical protein